MQRVAAILSVLIGLALSGGIAAAAIAIAFNTSTGRAGAYNGSWDVNTAKRVALDKCGPGCRIIYSGKGTCAAVVESISTGTSAWAVATGTTKDTAAKSAWFECRRKGGVNCRTAAAICE